jgi:hypothetical protein
MRKNLSIFSIILLVLALASSINTQTPADQDEVHMNIIGYTDHKWYSGKYLSKIRLSSYSYGQVPLRFLLIAK